MDQGEEPKSSLCGEHENQSRAQRKKTGPEPQPSCVSFKSDWSRDWLIDFKPDVPSDNQTHERLRPGPESGPGPGPRCVSMKSDNSMDLLFTFKPAHHPSFEKVEQQSSEVPSAPSAQQHQSQLDSIFMLLEDNMLTFVKEELKKIQKALSPDDPQCLESQREDEDAEQRSSREALVKITVHFLRRMKQEELAERLRSKHSAAVCGRKLKSALKKKFQCVLEGISKAGNPTLLNQIYTELYITEGGVAGLNGEHEVRQIEIASRKAARPETTIRQEDVFKGPPGREQPIRAVLTKGVAGIGKTVLTQKFTLDWAEGKANQDIHFLFPFTFRELNVLRGKQFSLLGLLHHFFPETRAAGVCSSAEFQVVFIFDGLDESRLPLDFQNQEPLTDITESSSVDVLLTSLIRGKLLPSARLWITTRPAAANQIPADCVSMVTEVRGFTDEQKEVYFRKRFRDEEQASSIISHIKSCRSLHIMCHIPVFCWISATVLEDLLRTRGGGQLPRSLTEMYIHFLVVQAKVKRVKYDGGAETDPPWSPETRKMVESLGKLAFDQLQKGNLIFYESDLTECGIDISAASVYSGVFTQVFKEESGLYQDRVFCFVHLSVQEFLAALHVHLTFISSGTNLLEEQKRTFKRLVKKPSLPQLHQTAVKVALQSQNGHLDLFLRFLLGLSLQTNQRLLQGLLTQTGSSSQTNQGTVQYIKKKLSEHVSAERSINLFHCLNELNDGSLVEEVQQALSSGSLSTEKLSSAQWSALVFILLSSEKDLDEFDLKKYSASEEALLRLLPVVKASKKALLRGCNLSERSCEALSSILNSESSSLTHMDLSNNQLRDSGVKHVSAGLESPNCRLKTLRLSGCNLSERSCEALSSVLSSQSSSLTHLDLSNNQLRDSGVKHVSAGLESPNCRLETLRLEGCTLSETSCSSVVSALKSNPSHLTELDLSWNPISECVMKELSSFLQSPLCGLKTLRLQCCWLSNISGASLVSVLKSKSSCLTELDLRYNHNLQESVTKQLSELVKSPIYKMKTLRLERCCVSEISCAPLASALESNPSGLRKLNLNNNNLKDSEVKQLCGLLGSDLCILESLRLKSCRLSETSCASVVSALKSNPSHLTELDLSWNPISECVMKELSSFLQTPLCGLKTLRLMGCSLSETSCAPLVSALKCNPSHLTELDLSGNPLKQSDVQQLLDLQQSPHNKLQTLRWSLW
ncbi:NACHT, LRR and PYD domains-containing protein 12-like isoform 9-T9 [Menidia menidia]